MLRTVREGKSREARCRHLIGPNVVAAFKQSNQCTPIDIFPVWVRRKLIGRFHCDRNLILRAAHSLLRIFRSVVCRDDLASDKASLDRTRNRAKEAAFFNVAPKSGLLPSLNQFRRLPYQGAYCSVFRKSFACVMAVLQRIFIATRST
jgi:hypothetical protein